MTNESLPQTNNEANPDPDHVLLSPEDGMALRHLNEALLEGGRHEAEDILSGHMRRLADLPEDDPGRHELSSLILGSYAVGAVPELRPHSFTIVEDSQLLSADQAESFGRLINQVDASRGRDDDPEEAATYFMGQLEAYHASRTDAGLGEDNLEMAAHAFLAGSYLDTPAAVGYVDRLDAALRSRIETEM